MVEVDRQAIDGQWVEPCGLSPTGEVQLGWSSAGCSQLSVSAHPFCVEADESEDETNGEEDD